MSIEKKSLISTLKTTKKANVAKGDSGSSLSPKANPLSPKANPLSPKARPLTIR